MPKIAKILVAVVLTILAVATMGMIGLKDLRHRPEYCANCHSEPYYESWASSDDLAHDHADAAISCQRCHPQTYDESLQEIEIYLKEGYRASSIQKKTPDDVCLTCHEDRTTIAERTQNYVIDGEVHNPHDPHAGVTQTSEVMDSATSKIPDSIECYRCHTMHNESPGVEYCFSCHHTQEFKSCSSSGCHDESESSSAGGGF